MHNELIKFDNVENASNKVAPDSRYQNLVEFGMSEINRFEQEKQSKQRAALNVKVETDTP